jgi:cellulose biosynthesis protein BcsQ
MIYTFYSYKGGVGRTMALSNIAELFSQSGNKVLVVDWDLEAPGLEHFFSSKEQVIGEQPGVMDILLSYKTQMMKDPVEGECSASGENGIFGIKNKTLS